MSDREDNIENDMEAMNMDTDRDKIRRLDEERRRKREETIRRARKHGEEGEQEQNRILPMVISQDKRHRVF